MDVSAGPRPLGSAIDPDRYRELFHAFDHGFCVFEVLVDEHGTPVDYRFLEVNHAFERLTGLVGAVGRTALELVPQLERHWIDVYGRVALTGESTHFVQQSAAMGRWFEVRAARVGSPSQRQVALLFNDITALRHEQDERRRAEDALRVSERRFRSFADTAPAMLWVTEPDGACVYLSRGWYDFTGQTEAETTAFSWLDAVHPADRGTARERFVAANARQTAFGLEHRLRRADGTYRWVLDAGRPRLDPDGRFAGFVGSVIDIHDRKLVEGRLELAVHSGRVGLWYCDLPFDVLVWNRQVKEHFGLPADAEITIDTFFESLHPDDREPTRAAIDTALAERSTYDVHYRTMGRDGQVRWIRAIGRGHYDEHVAVRFDGITIDVSELVDLRERAEAANRAKDEFLAMLSHELRNPLAPITTALHLLKLRGVEAVEKERAIIERQVTHLIGLVDDLLDISRITRGRLELLVARLDLADIVADAVEIASPLLELHGQHLTLGVPRGLCLDGDAARLAQAVANLLTNAAKYTPRGGHITVRGSSESEHVVLRVRDTGIGIAADVLPHVFDLFVQERQPLARSQGGLGLGLAIVRSLIEVHGGTVSAASDGKGHGSEFVVRLRRAPVDEPAAGPAQAAPVDDPSSAHAPGTRVLVVDDNRDAAVLLGALLRTFGYQTRVVHDAPTALAEAGTYRPHVALIDIGLPVMDGFELAHHLKQQAELQATPLVAVTGYGQAHDRESSAKAGFAAHLVKPVDAEALRELLQSLVGADPA